MKFELNKYDNTPKGFRQFCLDILENSFFLFSTRLRNIVAEYSEANVHSFRVTTRRFIAVLDMIHHFFPSPYIPRIKKSAKKHLKRLSRLRDIQVMTTTVTKMKSQYTVLFEFLEYLNKLELEQVVENKEYFKNIDIVEINDDFFHLKRSLKYDFLANESNFEDLKNLLLIQYKDLLKQKEMVDPLFPETIHKLRIKNKKFRYLVETTNSIFPKAKKICKILSTQQNKMGAIQDITVLIEEITQFAKLNFNLIHQLEPIVDMLEKKQLELIADFEKTSVILNNLNYFDLDEFN